MSYFQYNMGKEVCPQIKQVPTAQEVGIKFHNDDVFEITGHMGSLTGAQIDLSGDNAYVADEIRDLIDQALRIGFKHGAMAIQDIKIR